MALLEPELFELLRRFYTLVSPNNIIFPAQLAPSTIHAFFLDTILFSPHFRQYPPSAQYQKTFWKWAIHHLEHLTPDEDFEIDPRIYEHYLSLLPPSGLALGPAQTHVRNQFYQQGLPLQAPPSQSFITHFWKPSSVNIKSHPPSGKIDLEEYRTITLLESRTTIEGGTTGLRTWLASFVLSQYLISHPDLVANRRVLELGSGVGFLGIITASLQQLFASEVSSSSLWLTDVNEEVLARCRHNVQMTCNSSSRSNVNYCLLDWSTSTSSPQSKKLLQDKIQAELIVGADIIFDPVLIPALIGMLHFCLQNSHDGRSKIALIAATIRNPNTINQFLDLAQTKRLKIVELEREIQRTSFLEVIEGNNSHVKIFKITL